MESTQFFFRSSDERKRLVVLFKYLAKLLVVLFSWRLTKTLNDFQRFIFRHVKLWRVLMYVPV